MNYYIRVCRTADDLGTETGPLREREAEMFAARLHKQGVPLVEVLTGDGQVVSRYRRRDGGGKGA